MATQKPKPKPIKPKPPSQRDRGYTNILHHLSELARKDAVREKKQAEQHKNIERLLKKIMATVDELKQATDDLIQAVKDKAASVQAHIDELTAAINAGNATPEQLQEIADKLNEANAEVANIDAAKVVAAAKAKRAKR